MDLLNQILANTENRNNGPRIIGEQHDTGKINYGGEDAIKNANRRPTGPWDAAEYGISLEEAQRRYDAAQTPEGREKVILELKAMAIKRAGLDTSNGRVNMFAAGKLPWHGLGVNVSEALASKDAITLAGLNWDVAKTQLEYRDGAGMVRQAKGTYGIVRSDTGEYLGTVGNRYKEIQNSTAFDFLDGVLAEFGAKYESAGSLYNGQRVWMLVKMPRQSFTINGGDDTECYGLFTNPHDGSGVAEFFPTTVRVVCANTTALAIRNNKGKGLRIRHTGDLKAKIKIAKQTLGLAVESFAGYKIAAEELYKKPMAVRPYVNAVLDKVLDVTQEEASKGAMALAMANTERKTEEKELLDSIVKSYEKQIERRENVLAEILQRYENSNNSLPGIRGTAWQAVNAVTEYANHGKLGKESQDASTRASRRFESIMGGEADQIMQVAYQKAMQA